MAIPIDFVRAKLWKERQSKSHKGKHSSIKTEFKKGDIPWIKGKKNPYSELIIKAMSKAKKGKHISLNTEFKKGMIPWNKGLKECYVLSEKTKRKISKTKKQNMTKELLKRILTKRMPTSLEEKFQKLIDKNDLPYKYVGNGSFIIEKCNPDFINTNNEKIAIEVYARYYKLRNNISIEEWKEKRNKVFNDYGWKIIFFDEIEVNEKNVLEKIKKGSDKIE